MFVIRSILYNATFLLVGKGFAAKVMIKNGKALREIQDGEIWYSGVTPVGFAAHKLVEFEKQIKSILEDKAAEAEDFSSFEELSSQFLSSHTEQMDQLWQQNAGYIIEEKTPIVGEFRIGKLPWGEEKFEVVYRADDAS